MRGAGASELWTDGTDAGGMFRQSIRTLCTDLQSPPPPKLVDGKLSQPLFTQTINYATGAGSGESALEKFVPNALARSTAELDRFEFFGTLCGASARTVGFIECDMPSVVWKRLLGEALGIHERQ